MFCFFKLHTEVTAAFLYSENQRHAWNCDCMFLLFICFRRLHFWNNSNCLEVLLSFQISNSELGQRTAHFRSRVALACENCHPKYEPILLPSPFPSKRFGLGSSYIFTLSPPFSSKKVGLNSVRIG